MMKLAKGVMLGTLVSAGVVLMYYENTGKAKKKILKRGKKFLKEMGL